MDQLRSAVSDELIKLYTIIIKEDDASDCFQALEKLLFPAKDETQISHVMTGIHIHLVYIHIYISQYCCFFDGFPICQVS